MRLQLEANCIDVHTSVFAISDVRVAISSSGKSTDVLCVAAVMPEGWFIIVLHALCTV